MLIEKVSNQLVEFLEQRCLFVYFSQNVKDAVLRYDFIDEMKLIQLEHWLFPQCLIGSAEEGLSFCSSSHAAAVCIAVAVIAIMKTVRSSGVK